MPAFVVPANYAFETYDDLVAAINDWLDRSDLTGVAGQMIALAEARIRRGVAGYFDEAATSIACTAGVGTLPADFGMARSVVYNGRVLPQYSFSVGSGIPEGSIPQAWSIEAGNLHLWPETSATVTLLYQPSLVALTETTQTNSILDRHPDLYFYGSLMFANGYLANDERAGTFKSLFDEALAEVREYLNRQRFGAPLVPRLSVP